MPKGGFWTGNSSLGYEPKRKFRYRVFIEGMALEDDETSTDGFQDAPNDPDPIWYIKTCDKPSFTYGTLDGDQLDFGAQMPNVVGNTIPQWKPITMTFVDPSYPNASRKLMRLFRRAGYLDATAQKVNGPNSFDFSRLKSSTGQVRIEQLDANGKPLETWELIGAFPSEVSFGQLDYSSDELVEIQVQWAYSAAFLTAHGQGNDLGPRHGGEAMQESDGYDGDMTERSFTYQKDALILNPSDDDIPPGGAG